MSVVFTFGRLLVGGVDSIEFPLLASAGLAFWVSLWLFSCENERAPSEPGRARLGEERKGEKERKRGEAREWNRDTNKERENQSTTNNNRNEQRTRR